MVCSGSLGAVRSPGETFYHGLTMLAVLAVEASVAVKPQPEVRQTRKNKTSSSGVFVLVRW